MARRPKEIRSATNLCLVEWKMFYFDVSRNRIRIWNIKVMKGSLDIHLFAITKLRFTKIIANDGMAYDVIFYVVAFVTWYINKYFRKILYNWIFTMSKFIWVPDSNYLPVVEFTRHQGACNGAERKTLWGNLSIRDV